MLEELPVHNIPARGVLTETDLLWCTRGADQVFAYIDIRISGVCFCEGCFGVPELFLICLNMLLFSAFLLQYYIFGISKLFIRLVGLLSFVNFDEICKQIDSVSGNVRTSEIHQKHIKTWKKQPKTNTASIGNSNEKI